MIISLGDGYTAEWNGGHYIHYVTPHGHAHDCFSFDWELDRPTQLQAFQAFLAHEALIAEEAML